MYGYRHKFNTKMNNQLNNQLNKQPNFKGKVIFQLSTF